MSNSLLLNNLLHLSQDDVSRTKIKFNLHHDGKPVMEVFLQSSDYERDAVNTTGLFWRNKQRNFKVGDIAVCLLQKSRGSDIWLLSTIKEVTRELDVYNGVNYEGKEIDEFKPYFGRVLVKYRKSHTTGVVNAHKFIKDIEVVQILPNTFDGVDFPGYDKVRLPFEHLAAIIQRNKRDWIAALENQKAVYLITDQCSGKQYVGSAYGENGMLLQRWTNYISNGHGGNKLLRDIVYNDGIDYVKKYFQYAIIENYNARTDKQIILERESWWKKTLGSRAFGLNEN